MVLLYEKSGSVIGLSSAGGLTSQASEKFRVALSSRLFARGGCLAKTGERDGQRDRIEDLKGRPWAWSVE